MSGRFVRASKYRHVFGRPTRREQCYDNLRVSRNAWDTNLLKVNPEYLSINWETGGGGAFAVIPLSETGKLPERIPLFRGHTAVVLDTDWNPWNDSLIASGSDDGKVLLWRVPDGFTVRPDVEEIQDVAPVGKLSGHPRKVGHVLFNPAAENVLATASGDFTVKLWDIEAGAAKLTLKHAEAIQSLSWNASGSLLATTSRDKKLRFWDVRQEQPVHETAGHTGAKNSRCVWMGEHDRVATTGFSKMSDRQLALWDFRAPREPINGFKTLDSISGVNVPFWDDGTQCLYTAGKGDGNIRYFEYENDKFEFLSEYKSGDPQRGIAFMPKRGVNLHENEVMRAYKTVNDTYIEPISFIVPRRAEVFQDDIFPPTVGLKPAMSSGEWFEGKEALPPKIDMGSLYEGEGLKEVPADAVPKQPKPAPFAYKAMESKKEPEPAKPTPVAATPTPAPAPSMKNQGASMSAMADKYADNKEEKKEDEGDDSSDFEEVVKPVERTPTITISPAETQPREYFPPATTSSYTTEKPKEASTGSSTPTSATAGSGSESVTRAELATIKSLVAEQTRTIAAQQAQMQRLAGEIEKLEAKLG